MTSKLQFQDLTIGTGKTAERGALITAHYTGYLPDGTVFDSSHHRGQPFEAVIGTGRVIKGWDVGVLGSEYAQKSAIKPKLKTLPISCPCKSVASVNSSCQVTWRMVSAKSGKSRQIQT